MWYLFAIVSPPKLATLVLGASFLSLSAQAQETTLQGEPFGYVKINITGGTGTTKRTTLVSIPLLEEANISGKATGRITGVTSNTITVADAGWTEGQLSAASAPHLIEITSGPAKGRMFLLATATANTADTVTVQADEVARVGSLANLEIATGAQEGDTYRIRPVDTLSSFFGTPESTLIGGADLAAAADTVTIVVNGSASTHYYNTSLGRWTRVGLGNLDSSDLPIPPYAGLQYARLAESPLEFIVTGKVPSGERQVAIKNSGTTLVSPFWPVNQSLGDLGLQNTPNWVTGNSASTADTVALTVGGSVNTFFHDGTNWRRVTLGTPISNTNVVPVGASIMVNRKGNATGFAAFEHAAPYNIQ
jgi:hypothetical protein